MKKIVGEINRKLKILSNMKEREQFEKEVGGDDDDQFEEDQ